MPHEAMRQRDKQISGIIDHNILHLMQLMQLKICTSATAGEFRDKNAQFFCRRNQALHTQLRRIGRYTHETMLLGVRRLV